MSSAVSSAVSPRLALAQLAGRVVADVPGVGLVPGHAAWQTVQSGQHVDGVTCVVAPGGRYELGLYLVVGWPPEPFVTLAAELRRRVRTAAGEAGLSDLLDGVNVDVIEVLDPGAAVPEAGS